MQHCTPPALFSNNKLHQLTWHDGVELLDVRVSGEVFSKHSHDSFAIGIMEQGVGGNHVRGAKCVLPQNALSLMNPDELHTGYAITPTLKYKMLYISEASMRKVLSLSQDHFFKTCVEKDEAHNVKRRLAHIALILEAPKQEGWKLCIDSLLTELLASIMRMHASVINQSNGQEVVAVRRAKDYLDALATALKNPRSQAALEGGVSLAELAGIVGLQPNYFLNVFKKHVGVSPYAYWMTRRMQCAKHLLMTGYDSLDIVQHLKFYDQAHFIKTFKRFFGVTPRQVMGY